MRAKVEVPFGVYGALKGQPLKGQSWRGETDPWFREHWESTRFEGHFTPTSCDDLGAIQVRSDGDYWVVALTRPFEARNQTTWRAARIQRDRLWDFMLPLSRALKAPSDDEVSQMHSLRFAANASGFEDPAIMKLHRHLFSLYVRLDSEAETLPDPSEGWIVCTPLQEFEALLCCSAFLAEFARPRSRYPETSFVVLSRPAARRERKELLRAGWDFILAPPPETAETPLQEPARTRTHYVEPAVDPIRGVDLENLKGLSDQDFSNLFSWLGDPGAVHRWNIPFHLVPVLLRDGSEWEREYASQLDHPDSERLSHLIRDLSASPELDRSLDIAMLAEKGKPTSYDRDEFRGVVELLLPRLIEDETERSTLLDLCRDD